MRLIGIPRIHSVFSNFLNSLPGYYTEHFPSAIIFGPIQHPVTKGRRFIDAKIDPANRILTHLTLS
jgi:hypothetical protein